MPEQPRQRPTATYAAGLIERHDNHILIATFEGPETLTRLWHFPRGRINKGESPETAMRRIANRNLGIDVEIVVGQPPIVAEVDGEQAELRYFFCGLSVGEPKPGRYAEIQWIPKAHLQEYDFDPASRPVADWALRP
ncbi:MAG: NUDIX domain-containing protein [Phycisphaerae bacterium]|jgi:8-oxo-dGTP diphosphatase